MDVFKKYIPENVFSRGVYLEGYIGVKEIAWYYQEAIYVLEVLERNNIKILGGDVYKLSKDSFESTCDSWYFVNDGKDNLSKASASKAREYISSYYRKNGKCFAYSIVCSL